MAEHGVQFVAWARTALEQYALGATSLRFLGHSENITFQVVDRAGGEQFLLRLHRPSTANFEGIRQHPIAIESELRWLAALDRDTTITVQQPVRNAHGKFVTSITLPDATSLPCTLLRWVDGELLDASSTNAVDLMKPFGHLVALLHQHARTWPIPDTIVRPAYGADYFQHVVDLLHPGVADGIIEHRDYAIIQQTIEVIVSLMTPLEQDNEHWGLIHNDLHPGNCLVFGDEVRPIDFSLCGFGYFLFDLSTSIGSLSVALRQPFLDAYRQYQPLPIDCVRLIEACFIVSRMGYYAFTLPNPSQQPWLKQRIPQVVETICQRFLRNESFLFELR